MAEENKNIEEFFRRFSDTYPSKIPFNDSHWQQMEQMLDEQMPVDPPNGKGATWEQISAAISVISVLVLLFSVWGSSQKQPVVSSEVEAAIIEPVAEPRQQGSAAQHMTNEDIGILPTDEAKSGLSSNQSEVNNEQMSQQSVQTDQTSTIQSVSALEKASRSAESTIDSRSKSLSQAVAVEDGSGEGYRSVGDEQEQVPLTSDPTAPTTTATGWRSALPLYDPLPLSIDKEPVTARVVAPIEREVLPPVKDVEQPYPRIAVGILLSPDLSSNQLGDYQRIGVEIGLLMEYRLNWRWSVELGALSTQKKYLVNGHDYSPGEGFWDKVTNGQVPETIDAKCLVIDIPVNVRYRFVERDTWSLSGAAGLSSYLMLSEDYQYELGYGYDGWGTGHENDHFFSVANVQAYYERKLGRGFSMELAPFLKLPLTGYGHGNIKFHSVGLFFGFKRYFHWR